MAIIAALALAMVVIGVLRSMTLASARTAFILLIVAKTCTTVNVTAAILYVLSQNIAARSAYHLR